MEECLKELRSVPLEKHPREFHEKLLEVFWGNIPGILDESTGAILDDIIEEFSELTPRKKKPKQFMKGLVDKNPLSSTWRKSCWILEWNLIFEEAFLKELENFQQVFL